MSAPMHRQSRGLPVDHVLPQVTAALSNHGAAVLQAPPGAGKTTIVPLALLDAPWLLDRRIVMLEPRRLAARAAAHRMAALLGQRAGETVGYRIRMDERIGPATRVEVVTEGVLTRMVLYDPTLEPYGLVIFDEFHERSLYADEGLALVLHTRRLIRPDLRVLVMSATLDGTAVARLLQDAPVIASEGRQFEVATTYIPSVLPRDVVPGVAAAVRRALVETEGDILAFLPGAPEIHRVTRLLETTPLPRGVFVIPLYGMLPTHEQDRAIVPAPVGQRKVVLATSIAETSLTIDGVRAVVDSGLSRVPRYSPRTGMTRLHTVRVSRAAAEQRRGRAGRTAPGFCYRLWSEHETAQLLPRSTPEILDGDLLPLALDLAVAGITDPRELDWLDLPPAATYAHARDLLLELSAIDEHGRLTEFGRRIAGLGMHPRLAAMVVRAHDEHLGALACDLAALLGERDPLRGTGAPAPVDVRLRLELLRDAGRPVPAHRDRAPVEAIRRIRAQAAQWRARIGATPHDYDIDATGRLLALAWPDRLAQRRAGTASRYLLRNGLGAAIAEDDALAREPYLVIAETDGRLPESRIFLAAPITLDDLEREFEAQTVVGDRVEWSDDEGFSRAWRERRLGAIVLSRQSVRDPDPGAMARAIADAVRRRGLSLLPWTDGALRLRERLAFLQRRDAAWPDMSDEALSTSLLQQMAPALGAVRNTADLQRLSVHDSLLALLDWRQRAALDQLAPTHVTVPSGSRIPVDYGDPSVPAIAVRLQEMFGASTTPSIMSGRVPLTLRLLSPAGRPVQVTRDLSGFWKSSYLDVRRDLRGRYPKHDWPDDPASAQPTSRARRRR